MIIAVASGKGGTGKTTIATSLALTLKADRQVRFVDCDAEAPNAHLLLQPSLTEKMDATILVPTVDQERCTLCGVCAQVCRFGAIAVVGQRVMLFPDICHGCGNCTLNCAPGAIHERVHVLGTLESGFTADGIPFARGTLRIGETWVTPVIRQLRHWFPAPDEAVTIIDSPPGTSCPVSEAISGADFVILVTEPTPFGLHDLQLAHELTRQLELPAGVIINRDGIGNRGVDDYCAQVGLPVLMRIPADREIAAGLAEGRPLVAIKPEYGPILKQCFDTMVGIRP